MPTNDASAPSIADRAATKRPRARRSIGTAASRLGVAARSLVRGRARPAAALAAGRARARHRRLVRAARTSRRGSPSCSPPPRSRWRPPRRGRERWGRALAIFALAAAARLRPDLVAGRSAPPAPRARRDARMVEFDGAVEKRPASRPREQSVRLVDRAARRRAGSAAAGVADQSRRGKIATAAIAPGATVRLTRLADAAARRWRCPAPMISPAPPGSSGIGGSGRALGSATSIAPATDRGLATRGSPAGGSDLADHIREPARRRRRAAIAAALATGDQAGMSRGGCRGDAPLGPRPSALGQRAAPHRGGRRGDAADAQAARAEPDAGACAAAWC